MELPTSQRDCVAIYGNMGQVARLKRYASSEGKAAGVEAVDLDTGGGFSCTILPGRGMDIAWTSYRGIPVSYMSKTGIVSPAYHDPRASQWLKSFFSGLLTTCGLGNAGPACEVEVPIIGMTPFGLHGDISNTAADNICLSERWLADGRYQLKVSGRVEEGRFHGEHLEMRRTIHAFLGERKIAIEDTFSNTGSSAQPLMFFYHINLGYPILSKDSRFLSKSKSIVPANKAAAANLKTYDQFSEPLEVYDEQQFYHDLIPDESGYTTVALINDAINLGVYLRFMPSQLPKFAQWKVCRAGEYVFAFEPGNCHPVGRAVQEKTEGFEWLEPMQVKTVNYEIGMLDGESELAMIKEKLLA